MGQENDELLMKIVAGLRLVSMSMQSFAMILYKKEQEGGGEERVDGLSFLSQASIPEATICDVQTF